MGYALTPDERRSRSAVFAALGVGFAATLHGCWACWARALRILPQPGTLDVDRCRQVRAGSRMYGAALWLVLGIEFSRSIFERLCFAVLAAAHCACVRPLGFFGRKPKVQADRGRTARLATAALAIVIALVLVRLWGEAALQGVRMLA
jgi:hypothetical protein